MDINCQTLHYYTVSTAATFNAGGKRTVGGSESYAGPTPCNIEFNHPQLRRAIDYRREVTG